MAEKGKTFKLKLSNAITHLAGARNAKWHSHLGKQFESFARNEAYLYRPTYQFPPR